MSSEARDAIAQAACEATAFGRSFPWHTLNDREKDAWRGVADAVSATLRDAVQPVLTDLEADLQARTNEVNAATINFAAIAASGARLVGAKRILEVLGIDSEREESTS